MTLEREAFMDVIWHDFKYGIRTLARTPGLTLVAVITLALGIGANTAIFSVVYAVLLRPLPYPRPAELVALNESLPPGPNAPARRIMAITPPTTRDWTAAGTFANMAFYAATEFILTGGGEPVRVGGADVSGSFFETFNVPPAAGRPINREDEGPNRPLVCVLGYELWRSRFGGDASLIGKSIDLSGRRHAVIGIAKEGFAFPSAAQIWVPLAIDESEYADDQRLSFYLQGVARLKPGATVAQASADLNLIATRLAAQFPDRYEGRGAVVVSLQQSAVAAVRPALLLLLGTVGCVLLIACVNVANLLLARAAARDGEMATRAALGASRGRLLQQLLVESAILAAAGAVCGVLMAMWARDAIVSISPANVPRLSEVRIDAPVLGFTLVLATLTAFAFGLVPAFLSSRQALASSLAAGRKGTSGSGSPRLRGTLVVAQLALSLALLTGAGLLARALWNLTSVDPGFSADGVMTMEVMLPRAKYPDLAQRAEFFTRVVELLGSNPLVRAAGGTTNLPLSSTNMSFGFFLEDMIPDRDAPLFANVRGITAGYFEALSIPVIAGRGLARDDRAGSDPVVLINDAMRRKFWPNDDPIGQRISITRGRTTIWREIVGVAGDIRHAGLGAAPAPEIYMPYAHDPFFWMRIAVRSDAPRDALAGAMRAAVWAIDPAQPVSSVRPMADLVAASVASERFNAILIGAFAGLALALAAVGLYGVISYSVTLRRHEFGVRVALGAERRHLAALVLRQSLTLAVCGLGAGFLLALLLTRTVESQLDTELYEITPTDPVTFLTVGGILLGVALAATLVPAGRAMRADPMMALREG